MGVPSPPPPLVRCEHQPFLSEELRGLVCLDCGEFLGDKRSASREAYARYRDRVVSDREAMARELGTPAYMAPERTAKRPQGIDAKTRRALAGSWWRDVALRVVLWWLERSEPKGGVLPTDAPPRAREASGLPRATPIPSGGREVLR